LLHIVVVVGCLIYTRCPWVSASLYAAGIQYMYIALKTGTSNFCCLNPAISLSFRFSPLLCLCWLSSSQHNQGKTPEVYFSTKQTESVFVGSKYTTLYDQVLTAFECDFSVSLFIWYASCGMCVRVCVRACVNRQTYLYVYVCVYVYSYEYIYHGIRTCVRICYYM